MRHGLALLLALQAAPLPAQPAPTDGGRLAVYLVTFGPGPLVWERFGHNALWIRDTLTGTGPAYDFGRFDFRQERFFQNFADGRMMYWMGREDGVALVNFYVGRERSVLLQELAIAPEARLQLQQRLDSAFTADRGRYRYHYFLDNCSTRIRDAIDAAVGGQLREVLDQQPVRSTWRFHARRSLQDNVPQYYAITAALGPASDSTLTWWDESFLPGKLAEYARGVLVPAPDGTSTPLVKAELQVAENTAFDAPSVPADWTGHSLGMGLAGAVLFILLGRLAPAGGWRRVAFLGVTMVWLVLAGLAGAVFSYFWGLSEHSFAWRNQNLWQLNLLSLALLPALPAALRGQPVARRLTLVLATVIGLLAAIGPVAERLMAGWHQANADIVALTLPLQLGMAVGVWLALRRRAAS